MVSRAAQALVVAVREQEPAVEIVERPGGDVEPTEISELLSPSLFGERRVIRVVDAQDVRAEPWRVMAPFVADPDPTITLLLQHPGGAKGKAVLEAVTAAKAPVVACVAPSRPEERVQFVRAEVRRVGGEITPDAAAALIDAVGTDLRELSAVASQLSSDTGGRVDVTAVAAFHRGKAEVNGFAVADLAVVGRVGEAVELVRWALSVGAPPVVLADALADGVRSIAKVLDTPRGNGYELASRVGMAPWKVERAQRQARGWSDPQVADALRVVAVLNADVKGEAVDPGYAIETAVRRVATLARSGR
ncbi:DNA polymerase III subunit delta [Jatrophihabitans sp. YIM 134969]